MQKLRTRFIKLGRTLREGFRNFHRDGWLTFATVSVMTLSLYTIVITAFLVMVGTALLTTVESRVSISAYFFPSATEEQIMSLKQEISKAPEISTVTYVSREQALADFKTINRDPIIRDAIAEFEKAGDNPLYASLVIKTHDPKDYETIATMLTADGYTDIISDVNYAKNQPVIDQISRMMRVTKQVGSALSIIFVLVAILVVYNTVRITMFSRRQEFDIMRLVGASNMYVRMPSVYEGVFYGVTAGVVTVMFVGISAYILSPMASDITGSVTLWQFYLRYFWRILSLTLATGVGVCVFSGVIAIQRHLKA